MTITVLFSIVELLCSRSPASVESQLDMVAKLVGDIAYERKMVIPGQDPTVAKRYEKICQLRKETILLKDIRFSYSKKYIDEWRILVTAVNRATGKKVYQQFPYEYPGKAHLVTTVYYGFSMESGQFEVVKSPENRCHYIANLLEDHQLETGVWSFDIDQILKFCKVSRRTTASFIAKMKIIPGKVKNTFVVYDSTAPTVKMLYRIDKYGQLAPLSEYFKR